MNTLGLSFFYHDSAAALVTDGQIVAAAAEERFSRRKHTNEFPKLALEYCLEAGSLASVNELDAIVFYEKPLLKLTRVLETYVATWPRAAGTFCRKFPVFLSGKLDVARVIQKELPGYRGEVYFSRHHLSHAASAFFCSPFREAAILTLDGVGEWETTALGHGRGRDIRLKRTLRFPHSLGLLYSALTSYLGFQVNDGEWKVMGLAPYGQPIYADQFRRLVRGHPDGSFQLDMRYFSYHYSSRHSAHATRWEKLFGFPPRAPGDEIAQHHEDLARSGQLVVEELILALAREARRLTGSENLVIGGGVGLNGVANWRIEREGIFKNVWIQPAAGDDGGALGAALVLSQGVFNDPPCGEMTHAYLGPEFSDEEIGDFLREAGIAHCRLEDAELVEEVGNLLASGKVVGWFRGRMEFGPRALGARSILGDATKGEMKATINRKIKYREYFRPFAPVVPCERVSEFFEVPPGASLPFMIKVPSVREGKRALIPAVTHEDGTGRVQTVSEQSNPLLHRLLVSMEPKSGAPVLLNTSFNVRGEPIVCTPQQAYDCFLRTGIDALVLGNHLLTEKAGGETDAEVGFARSDEMERDLAEGSRATTGDKVLSFYRGLPFNYFSNSPDCARELLRANRLKEYPALLRYLRENPGVRVLDVGCGAGWFVNSCAHYHNARATGIDFNPRVLQQARAVARLVPGAETARFLHANVFDFEPGETFDVVNSLGALHHTGDCHAAIRRALRWVAPGGFFHLGLYHLYGRKPFLDHFASLKKNGATHDALYEAFRALNPEITDEVHLNSWYRDQVVHPHETQHTYEEVAALLEQEGFVVEATSLNHFGRLPSHAALAAKEKSLLARGEKALRRKRYFPGFFVVWARRRA